MSGPAIRGLAVAALSLVALFGAGGLGAAPDLDPLDARREQVRALEAELSRIDAEAGAAADAHAAAAQRLRQLRAGIARNGRASRSTRAAHIVVRDRLADRLVAIYTRRDPGALEVLLATGNLSDAVAVRDVQERVGRRDAALVAELRDTRARLAAIRRALVAERAEAVTVADHARERLAEVEILLDRRRLVLDRARSSLDGLIERRARAAALARARVAAEAAARARARAVPDATATPPAPAPATPETPEPADRPVRAGAGPIPDGPSYEVLNRIARCESGGNPRAMSSSGQYRGKYQFDLGTWASVGGSGDPAAASEAEQDLRAAMLYAQRGPAPWPICGYR